MDGWIEGWDGMGWDGMRWDGMGWDGMGLQVGWGCAWVGWKAELAYQPEVGTMSLLDQGLVALADYTSRP